MPNTSGNKIFILLPSPSSTFTLSSYSLFYYIRLYPIILFLILLHSSSSAFTLLSYSLSISNYRFILNLGIDPRRLTREQLLLELTKRKINVDKTAKKDELIKELELALTNNIEIIQGKGKKNYKKFQITLLILFFILFKKCFRRKRRNKYYMINKFV
jgi:hypothetical protein